MMGMQTVEELERRYSRAVEERANAARRATRARELTDELDEIYYAQCRWVEQLGRELRTARDNAAAKSADANRKDEPCQS